MVRHLPKYVNISRSRRLYVHFQEVGFAARLTGSVALRDDIVQFGYPRDAQMTKPIARDLIYRRRRFDAEVIELCVRWYITYRLSYRDLVAMMAERGIAVSHTTIQQARCRPR